MKHTIQLLTLMALLISLPVYCQDDDPVFVITDRMPVFRGNLQNYLRQSIQYPQEALEQEMEGQVIVRMIINKDSTVSDVTVARSSGNELLDQEAVRVIESMPKWKPGVRNGKAVRANLVITLPIPFRGEEMTIIREEGAPVNVHGRYIIQ